MYKCRTTKRTDSKRLPFQVSRISSCPLSSRGTAKDGPWRRTEFVPLRGNQVTVGGTVKPSCFLTLNRRDDLARVLARPELKVPDALPSASIQATVADGDGDAGANKTRLDVCLVLCQHVCPNCVFHRLRLTGMSSRPSAECLYMLPLRSSGATLR